MNTEPADDEVSARRRAREAAGLESVEARAVADQRLAFGARDFVMCGLPFKRPLGGRTFRRTNGEIMLEMVGHPDHGLPYGQDRLLAIWLSTAFFAAGKPDDNIIRFRSAMDILRAFNMGAGVQLTRLRGRINRMFHTVFDVHYLPRSADDRIRKKTYRLMHEVSINLCGEKRRHVNQYSLWQDWIELDAHFAAQLRAGGAVPVDLETVIALKECSPALDLYIWQAWRSFRLERDRKPPTSIPVFGEGGLMAQLGSSANDQRKIRWMLRGWQAQVARVWRDCPNYLDDACSRFHLQPGNAIRSDQSVPELPGVSMLPPPLRETSNGEGKLVLVAEA